MCRTDNSSTSIRLHYDIDKHYFDIYRLNLHVIFTRLALNMYENITIVDSSLVALPCVITVHFFFNFYFFLLFILYFIFNDLL